MLLRNVGFLFAVLPLAAQNYAPLSAEERLKWFGTTTYGPRSLLVGGTAVSAWRTWRNRPHEWGPGWEGFGKRYGARILGNTFTNGVEASMGALWDEDPRYFRRGEGGAKKRLGNALKQTFMSRFGDGEYRFGAAKATGIVGGAFAQKMWMPDSVTTNRHCLYRIGGGYSGRFVGNLFREFLPDLKRAIKRKK
ncbi:MAG TPA: hypothetical protein VFQ91_05110 [Bryobacteraceae bacterium]|nr:hypothetical protein [Bryobacteraceae bacterium]